MDTNGCSHTLHGMGCMVRPQGASCFERHWMVWTKPIVFIWSLDLLIQGPHWSVWLTASALFAYASGSVIGRPTMRDARKGNRIDQVVLLWYLLFSNRIDCRRLYGSWKSHHSTSSLARQQRKRHCGGRTLCIVHVVHYRSCLEIQVHPRWCGCKGIDVGHLAPPFMDSKYRSTLMLRWTDRNASPSITEPFDLGRISVRLIPLILLLRNIATGSVRTVSDLFMAWMSLSVPLASVRERHVWILSDTMDMPSGETVLIHKSEHRRTPTDEEMNEHIHRLEEIGAERIWVSLKLPLLLFLFPQSCRCG